MIMVMIFYYSYEKWPFSVDSKWPFLPDSEWPFSADSNKVTVIYQTLTLFTFLYYIFRTIICNDRRNQASFSYYKSITCNDSIGIFIFIHTEEFMCFIQSSSLSINGINGVYSINQSYTPPISA